MQEYKKQGIYIFLGFIALLFPFLKVSYLLILFFGLALFFSQIRAGSPVFKFFARETDIKAGRLVYLIHFFFIAGALLLINLIMGPQKLPLFIIGGALAVTTFGDGFAGIVKIHEKAKNTDPDPQNDIKVYSANSGIVFLISGSVYAIITGAWIWIWTEPVLGQVTYGMIFFLAVLGGITGALLGSITSTEENIIIPFGSAMTMWLFYTFSFSYEVNTLYLIEVLVFAFALGYLAYKARIADISAMFSATLLGVVIIVASSINWFFMLLTFFLLGGLFTRYKYSYKRARGIAEGKGGVRGYKNVFSNSLAALCLAVGYGVFPSNSHIILSAYLGSIATATGDTLASEIGQTYRGEPRMITSLKKAPVGTDGAISHLGEAAAFFGALVIALLAVGFIKNDAALVIAIVAGGFIGTNIDSVLGATLQQKGYLSNNGVNLFATVSGAAISAIIYYLMGS